MWDHKRTGPGSHQDHSALKVLDPTPHHQIDWAQKTPVDQDWMAPQWWDDTKPARDMVGQEWDQHVATQFAGDVIPRFASVDESFSKIDTINSAQKLQDFTFLKNSPQKRTAGSGRIPWILWGEQVWIGQAGETFMNLARRELGYSMEEVWEHLPEHEFSAGVFDPASQRIFPQDNITSVQQSTIYRALSSAQ